jgi:hypothetical protein
VTREVWNHGVMKHGSELSFDDDGRPVLITRAPIPYEDQHRERVRKYLKIMSWRVPALLGAAIAYGIWHNGLISLAILVASIPLPWIAVLIANDGPPRTSEKVARDIRTTRTVETTAPRVLEAPTVIDMPRGDTPPAA